MGSVTILYRKPKQYARFLGQELLLRLQGAPARRDAERLRRARAAAKPLPAQQAIVDRLPAPGASGAQLADRGDARGARARRGVGRPRRAAAAPRLDGDEHDPRPAGDRRRRGDRARPRRRADAARGGARAGGRPHERARGAALAVRRRRGVVCAGCGSSQRQGERPAAVAVPRLPAQAADGGTVVRRCTTRPARSLGSQSERGHWFVVAFLYTHCPDVCPLIANNLGAAMREAARPARARDQRRSERRHAGGGPQLPARPPAAGEVPLPHRHAGRAGAGLEEVPHRASARPEGNDQPQRVRAAGRPEWARSGSSTTRRCAPPTSSTTCRC